jgi:hypothetical protein
MKGRVLAIFVLMVTLAASAQAQNGPGTANGVPASVTSFGFGGHAGANGPPASVTTSGWDRFPRPVPPFRFQQPVQDPGRHHHHQNQLTYDYYPYYIPYFPVTDPYAYGGPVAEEGSPDPEQQDQYQGGPTVFDRRGNGDLAPNDYVHDHDYARERPVHEMDHVKSDDPRVLASRTVVDNSGGAVVDKSPIIPVASQPDTILIFKDGHKQEVGNYAIVGTNLFDLTPGHRLKIALADLDVPATRKANEDQGVDFTLPGTPTGN